MSSQSSPPHSGCLEWNMEWKWNGLWNGLSKLEMPFRRLASPALPGISYLLGYKSA